MCPSRRAALSPQKRDPAAASGILTESVLVHRQVLSQSPAVGGHGSQAGNPEPVRAEAKARSVDVLLLVLVALIALEDTVFARVRVLE